MSKLRFNAVATATNRAKATVQIPESKISDYFASNVFTTDTMRQYLSKDAFQNMLNSINAGAKLDRVVADQVASAMKSWAISKGA